mmetsp:Transcript_14531/g.41797  ORF Transcript_14531/g.41797 Transcript_14531/m.41797 type:complete len:314 (-) Transcript_14531:259-1200(-)
MARGAAGKLRRRNRKQEDKEAADRIFAGTEEEEQNGSSEFNAADIPLPPGMDANAAAAEDDDSSEEEEKPVAPKKKKKSKARSADAGDIPMPPKKKAQGIKTLPLVFLILMTGTTLLPVVLYASDYLGNFMAKNNVLGQIGFRLGMGAVPKKRVLSFYEKHDPNKIEEVPNILSKYYGDYPTLVKKLERKYQDYGYFLGWEEDEAPLALAMEQLQETYNVWLTSYWNVYAPQPIKTGVRNIRYNILFLKKKFIKAWKKHIWPTLEPFLGVPKGAEKQKRQDAAEARKRRQRSSSGGTGTRRRSAEFRDDVDED